MASGKCTECGNIQKWSAKRGRKLSDLSCDKCGGPLEGMTAGRASRSRGKKYVTCGHCQKKTLRILVAPIPLTMFGATEPIQAGTPICRWHEAVLPEPEAVELGFLVIDEPPQASRTWMVNAVQYVAKLRELGRLPAEEQATIAQVSEPQATSTATSLVT